jgi:hypothetical protein
MASAAYDEVTSLLGIDLTQPVLVLRLIVRGTHGGCLQVSDRKTS